LIANGYKIAHYNLATPDSDYEPIMKFVTYNSVNNLYLKLRESTDAYKDESNLRREGNYILLLIVTLLCIFFTGVLPFALIFFVRKVYIQRKEVLSLLMGLDQEDYVAIMESCDRFLHKLTQKYRLQFQMDDDKDSIEGTQEMKAFKENCDVVQDKMDLISQTNRMKTHTNSYTRIRRKLFIMVALFELFYIIFIFLQTLRYDRTQVYTQEFDWNARITPNNRFIYMTLNELAASDGEGWVLNRPILSSYKPLYDRLELDYEEYYTYHLENSDKLADSYNDLFDQIYRVNPCPELYSNNAQKLAACNTMAANVFQKGGHAGSLRYWHLILNQFNDYEDTRSKDILKEEDKLEADDMLNDVITPSNRKLTATLEKAIEDYFSYMSMVFFVTAFSFFWVFLGFYLIIWRKEVSRLKNVILKTRRIVTILPVSIILKNAKVRRYFANSQDSST